MAEWLSYSLQDFLLFAPRTYYRLFELHNRAVWPGQILALGLGVALLALLRRGGERAGRAAAVILAACWLWVAWAYHLQRYETINWAARYLAAGFALQGAVLLATGLGGRLALRPGRDPAAWAGAGLLAFALAVQPLLGPLSGRAWAAVELFGIAPDPTVTATLGVLLAARRLPWEALALPLLWCAITGATAWAMAAPDAPLMPAVAALGLGVAVWRAASAFQAA